MKTSFRWPACGIVAGLVLLLMPVMLWAAESGRIGKGEVGGMVGGGVGGELTVKTVWQYDAVRPGEKVELLIQLNLAAGWHINADESQVKELDGFRPVPTQVAFSRLPEGLVQSQVIYPKAKATRVSFADSPVMLFEDGQVIRLLFTATKAASAKVDGAIDGVAAGREDVGWGVGGVGGVGGIGGVGEVTLSYQACDDQTCRLPTKLRIPISIRIADDASMTPLPEYQALAVALGKEGIDPSGDRAIRFDVFGREFSIDLSNSTGFLLLLMTAAIGGLLLNMTPCVLPVLPLKIMALAQAGENRRRTLLLGVCMSLGVVGFWLLLGLLIGTATGLTSTNELFRYPAFTLGVGLVIAVMAVGMCGLFSIQPPAWVYRWSPKHETMFGSMGFGVMTAILSTPCTAPLMGAAAAWAATQRVGVTLAVFASIGLGMALPYLILPAWPDLARKMPKTGPASLIIKETMGLLMLAAAAYFAGSGISAIVTPAGQPIARGHWWVVMAMVAIAAGWCLWRTAKLVRRAAARSMMILIGLLIVAACAWAGERLTDRGPIDWIHYTDEQWAKAQASGRPILLDFTAEWCLNCKALESTVLHSPRVVQAIKQHDILPIKVDLTRQDASASQLLQQHGRITIPWLVLRSADGQTIYASEAYTVDSLTQAMGKTAAKSRESK